MSWSDCPSCGIQSMTRQRNCTVPLYGGFICSGNWSETSMCPIPECPSKDNLDLTEEIGLRGH